MFNTLLASVAIFSVLSVPFASGANAQSMDTDALIEHFKQINLFAESLGVNSDDSSRNVFRGLELNLACAAKSISPEACNSFNQGKAYCENPKTEKLRIEDKIKFQSEGIDFEDSFIEMHLQDYCLNALYDTLPVTKPINNIPSFLQ